MYKYIILLALFSAVAVATNTKANHQILASNGNSSGEAWTTDWQTVSAILYSQPNGTEYSSVEICTQIQGQIKVKINVKNEDTNAYNWVDVFVPASATLDDEYSYCARNIPGVYKDKQAHFFESKISLVFYKKTFRLDIYFTNSTMIGSAGWLQFAIYKVELTAHLHEFPDIFPKANDTFSSVGTGYTDRWWKWLGTISESSYQCDHTQTVNVQSNVMTFAIQKMAISALNEGCLGQNKTYPANMCDFDYEQDDGLAVVIGTVQTAFVLITLVIYLIYLKRRGPVKVPDWIIEPAMRNASIQPIDDAAYDRKLSQISNGAGPDSDPMPTKRRTMNGNDDGTKY